MNDLERQAQLRALSDDNKAVEALAAAHGALLRAVQAIPNSVHSVFALPQDVRAIEAAINLVVPILGDAEIAMRQRDEELQRGSDL